MKIGLAIPCIEKDKNYLKGLMESISRLDPPPFESIVCFNDGSLPLKEYRSNLFDHLFNVSRCDVALSVDADFYLLPHITRYVRSDKVVSFADLKLKVSSLWINGLRLFWPRSWSGCYSLPSKIWDNVKDQFDGTDTSVKEAVEPDYVFVRKFCYYDRRPYSKKSVESVIKRRSRTSRMFYKFSRLQF